jgi:hypothetical protein
MSVYIRVVCNHCYETFDVDLQVSADFHGQNDEVYDCTICCNPNKISYYLRDGAPENIIVGDGND